MKRILIYRTEHLNYYRGQQEAEGGILEQIGGGRPTKFAIKTQRSQIRQVKFFLFFIHFLTIMTIIVPSNISEIQNHTFLFTKSANSV